jgi:hypothetical protein
MNFQELALAFDAQVRPLEAAWAYEIAINAPDAEVELFLNLAVLYLLDTLHIIICRRTLSQALGLELLRFSKRQKLGLATKPSLNSGGYISLSFIPVRSRLMMRVES